MINAVQFNNISKRFHPDHWAVKDVCLTIPSGEIFGLIGLNAPGKSTLIKMLSLLISPTSGAIAIFNIPDISKNPVAAKKLLGVMPQDFNFSPFETIHDVLVLQARCFAIPKQAIDRRIAWLLEGLDLSQYCYTLTLGALSGGIKPRVRLARAFLPLPPLVLLDEPSAGLDIFARQKMWRLLKTLAQNGMIILLTSHYLEKMDQLCRRVALLEKGKIV